MRLAWLHGAQSRGRIDRAGLSARLARQNNDGCGGALGTNGAAKVVLTALRLSIASAASTTMSQASPACSCFATSTPPAASAATGCAAAHAGVQYDADPAARMSSPELGRGISIKTNSVRGGVLENLYARDTTIGEVRDAIVIDFCDEEGDSSQFDPVVRNIE